MVATAQLTVNEHRENKWRQENKAQLFSFKTAMHIKFVHAMCGVSIHLSAISKLDVFSLSPSSFLTSSQSMKGTAPVSWVISSSEGAQEQFRSLFL